MGTVAARIDNLSCYGSCSTCIVLPGVVNHHVITAQGSDAEFVFRFPVWDVPAIYARRLSGPRTAL